MPPTTQVNGKSKPKTTRKRKGKSRTAVLSESSSSSNSDTSSDESTSQPTTKSSKRVKQEKKSASPASSPEVRCSPPDEELPDADEQSSQDEDELSDEDGPEPVQDQAQSFSNYYLRKVTTAFAEDLDKIRNASDFSEASLPLLIKALQQGEGCFSAEERRAFEGALRG